ncbi:unnamed protein product, partial [Didymodactylos carnosus]
MSYSYHTTYLPSTSSTPLYEIYRLFSNKENNMKDELQHFHDELLIWKHNTIIEITRHVDIEVRKLNELRNDIVKDIIKKRDEYATTIGYYINKNPDEVDKIFSQCEKLKFELEKIRYKTTELNWPCVPEKCTVKSTDTDNQNGTFIGKLDSDTASTTDKRQTAVKLPTTPTDISRDKNRSPSSR